MAKEHGKRKQYISHPVVSIRILVLLLSIAIINGCIIGIKTTVSKKYEPLDSLQRIHVLDVWQPVPAGAVEIGTVQIYDKMTMHCDSVTVFNAAKNEVRKAGGNVLKITKHSRP